MKLSLRQDQFNLTKKSSINRLQYTDVDNNDDNSGTNQMLT